jgi:hypothetical protein
MVYVNLFCSLLLSMEEGLMRDTIGFSSFRYSFYPSILRSFARRVTRHRLCGFIIGLLNLILTASDYILLRNHQPELRKIGQKKATSEMTFKERLMWSASLLATPRGIGWAHEPTDQIPPRPTASRGKFIASQFLWIIFYSILWDVALFRFEEIHALR